MSPIESAKIGQPSEAMEGSLNPLIIHRIGPERARHFIDNWRQLVVVLKRGELRPGHLKAVKAA
jgi:hypothetical protein